MDKQISLPTIQYRVEDRSREIGLFRKVQLGRDFGSVGITGPGLRSARHGSSIDDQGKGDPWREEYRLGNAS